MDTVNCMRFFLGSPVVDWVIAIGTVAGALITAAGFVMAIIEFRHSRKELAKDYLWRRRLKTDELAKAYAIEVAPLITYLLTVLRYSGAIQWIDMIKESQMVQFSQVEIHRIEQEINDRLPDGQGLQQSIEMSLRNMSTDKWFLCHGQVPESCRHIIDSSLQGSILVDAFLEEFHALQTETVNRLISFSNTIDFDLAIEDLIYPLVHDSFLEDVKVCYPRIATSNNPGQHQHAYSVQNLFLNWQVRKDEHVVPE